MQKDKDEQAGEISATLAVFAVCTFVGLRT
jgi:hypothetical protein